MHNNPHKLDARHKVFPRYLIGKINDDTGEFLASPKTRFRTG